ncbi:protein TALPID3 isoform X3 [Chelonia mydas]|uniref:protein TALPID3 isoform X3 n=1 Tax=Chelonia mydas TaxID=8469 RepID=UPI0018A21235|nr:protein TALPID3 isoform X3 [Chelonia mydas]XP_043404725.1 protein TALPID3 isoform X3 [Chelonia mydas]
MEAESNSSVSQDSTASFAASDVLIRSTSLHTKEKPTGTWTAAADCSRKKVKISVKKLREVASPYQADDAALIKDKTSYIPPALSANKPLPSRSTVTTSSSVTQAVRSMLAERSSEHLLSVENDLEPTLLSQKETAVKGVSLQVMEDGNRREDDDIFISQYTTGEKEALRAVLKQRTQNPPVFKEVKVQLLENVSTEKKKSAQDTRSAHSNIDSATTVAAATAAAIATTAPLLKVQSDLEAKVNSVSALLNKLQETDKQLQRVAEQQTNIKTQQQERSRCHDRVNELEKQMNVFMEQRIQHLEKLQQQQIHIQSHLISSAINTGGFQPVNIPSSNLVAKHSTNPELQQPLTSQVSSCHRNLFSTNSVPTQAYSSQFGNYGVRTQKSPLKTPAPRRYAPVPVSKDMKVSQKISKKERPIAEKENVPKSAYGSVVGGGRLLEQILNSQETPLRQTESSEKSSLNNTKMAWHSEREWPAALRTDSIPAFEGPLQDYNSINKTVKKAEDVLQDLGQLKKEMHGMLQEAKAWKSDMNDFVKPTNPVVAPSFAECPQVSKPSILQTVKAPKSVLKDAERILRCVQNNKKVLEENLEAIIRAKDGDAMYTFINALTTNRNVLEEIRIRKTVDEWIKAISVEIQAEMAKSDYEQTQYNQKDPKTPWIKRTQNTRDMKTNKEIKAKTQKTQGSLTKKYLSAAKPSQKQSEDNFRRQSLRSYSVSETLLKKEGRAEGPLKASAVEQNEEYLSQVYGKPIYQGHRSKLKKAPYLRFNSPSPKSKPQRPKVIECVKGTKVRSARTQTNSCTQKVIISPKRQRPLSAPLKESQYLFSPSREMPDVSGPLEGHLIPMAIPLGQTQINGISPQSAGVIIGKPHPVTVIASVLPAPPKPQSKLKKPNIAVIEMRSEKKDPPKLTVQVLPNVDIDSLSNDSVSINQTPTSSEAALPPVSSLIQGPEQTQYEEEDIKFPGTNFVDVTDVIQDQEEEDGIPELSEPILEFNRRTEVVSPKYNGPPFPPTAPASQQPADILDEIIERRETLENRLISWVEQEVMARIISEMYPVQKERMPSVDTSDSEESEAVTSDIVEAAGGGGFQLFVSAGVPVNSEMINHFVNEALTETIAVMLGEREAQKAVPAANVLQSTAVLPESVVSTPLATPPHTPLPEKEPSPVKTPVSSLSVTEIGGDVGEQEQMTETGFDIPAATTPIGTPPATPVDTPPRVTTPSPPVSEHGSDATRMGSPKPPNPWGDAELPLDEEKPSPSNEETLHPRAVVMSVAKDEEPEMLILPSPEPIRPFESLPCEPRVPSPVHTPSSGPSTHESSLTVTETETADKPISEGEVLFSYGQLVAARALAEGGLSLPNLSESLTSTLHDANEMDYDPPSEGQVMRRPHRGYHRDPVLSLFAKLNQAPVALQEVIYHSEDSDNSVGELSEGQRPRLTRAAESILMGRSVYTDQAAGLVTEQRPHHVPSPGECDRVTAELLGDAADVSHGPMSMAELESQPLLNPAPQTAQANDRLTSLSEDLPKKQSQKVVQVEPVRSRVIHVRNKSEVTQQQDSQGDMDRTHIEPNMYLTLLLKGEETVPHLSSLTSPEKMSVMLPSMNIDDQTQSISMVHGDSDSSGTDTF